MKRITIIGAVAVLTGCATTAKNENADMSAFLDTQQEVAVVKAAVKNPLPKCEALNTKKQTAHADLSVPRSIRGYMKNEEGDLCKKAQ